MIDLGTGAGGAVLAAARRAPDTLAIGVDTDAAAMREASRRAARSARNGGLPNVVFLAGTLSDLPGVLDGCVDELRVTLPWGSLLRDVLEPALPFVERVVRLLIPGGCLRLMLSMTDRDARIGRAELDAESVAALAGHYAEAGFQCVEARPTTSADVTELGSSWAKRLGIPDRRSAWTIVLRRPGHRHVAPTRRSYRRWRYIRAGYAVSAPCYRRQRCYGAGVRSTVMLYRRER